MRSLRRIVLASLLLIFASTSARAEGFITPFVGFNFGGDSNNCANLTSCEKKRTNFGVALGSMGTVFGFEEDFSYAKHFFGENPVNGTDNSVFSMMSNLLVGVGVGPVRPYVVGGFGLIRPHVSSLKGAVTTFDANKNAFGYDIGGGVTGMVGSHVGIRGDLRLFRTMQDIDLLIFTGQKLEFWRASVGVALMF